jgi:hypothetical protein
MPLGRDIRRLQNAKEGSLASGDTKSVLSYPPAVRNMRDGEQVFAQEGNKQLSLYKKHKGMLWKARFSRDGNQYIDKNLKVDGEIRGSRAIFNFGEATGSSSATWYMDTVNGVTMSTTRGYVMHRSGSIVGASVQCNCTSDAGTATMIITVLLEGSVLVQTSSTSVTSTGVWSNYEKFNRHRYPFTAGEFISIALSRSGDASTNDDAIGYFEVVFDD